MSFTSLFLCWLVQFSGELIVNHSLGNRVVLRTDNCAEGMGTSRGKKKEEKGGKKSFLYAIAPPFLYFCYNISMEEPGAFDLHNFPLYAGGVAL